MTTGVMAPPRGPVRLAVAGLLAAVLFLVFAVALLLVANGSFASIDAESTLGAIVVYDALVVTAALLALRLALRLTRRRPEAVLALDGEPGRPAVGELVVCLVPAVFYAVSGAISRGAGLLRLILDVAALVAVGTWPGWRCARASGSAKPEQQDGNAGHQQRGEKCGGDADKDNPDERGPLRPVQPRQSWVCRVDEHRDDHAFAQPHGPGGPFHQELTG